MKRKWRLSWPITPGNYWFYGYRWIDRGNVTAKDKPEMCLVRVREVSNGVIYIADGQFLYFEESHGWFCPAELPEPPQEALDFHKKLKGELCLT